MKNKISIAIILLSILISCALVYGGCTPSAGYLTIDARAGLMQPTFCMYRDASLQERLDIEGIMVWKVQRSAEFPSHWERIQRVWDSDYMHNQSTSPVSCLTYGEVPPGYQEDVKAVPLEPEQFYMVMTWADRGIDSEELHFIIRVDDSGAPKRLESH